MLNSQDRFNGHLKMSVWRIPLLVRGPLSSVSFAEQLIMEREKNDNYLIDYQVALIGIEPDLVDKMSVTESRNEAGRLRSSESILSFQSVCLLLLVSSVNGYRVRKAMRPPLLFIACFMTRFTLG